MAVEGFHQYGEEVKVKGVSMRTTGCKAADSRSLLNPHTHTYTHTHTLHVE